MRRLSCIINSYDSQEEERIWKSSKLAGCPEAFIWDRILDIAGLVECFQRENQVKSLLKKLKAENALSEKNYNELSPTGSRIGILYGLPKIHKPNMPLRPILSSVDQYSYKLAKFFIPLLTPLTINPFIITDSFSFVQELLNRGIDSRNVLISWLVLTLFPCSPISLRMKLLE